MAGALPQNGMGHDGTAQPADGLAVFHPQQVIGLAQQAGLLLHLLVEGPLPGGGIGDAGAQFQQGGGHRVVFHQGGRQAV